MQVDIEFYDIFDYYHIPFWQKTWFIVTAGVVACLILAAVLFFYYQKSRKKIVTPWDWARKAIAKLDTNACKNQEDFKRLYFELTTIIKTYLALRYAWSTHEKTDEEIIAWLEKQKFNAEIIEMLKKITDDALWIKFANQSTLKSQADTDKKTVLVMIERTTPTKK